MKISSAQAHVCRTRLTGPTFVRLCAIFVFFACSVCGAQPSQTTSTSPASEYTYQAKSLRDPFVPILTAGGGVAAMAAEKAPSKTFETIEELEKIFNPDNLVIRAMLSDASRKDSIAWLADAADANNGYVVKGSKIRHMSSGMVLTSFAADIEKDNVVIKKVKGDPLISVVSFPKDKEETKP
ncbi:MAG: hypothetical protein HY747_04165 [Elusimicrobia bacterium]|nr:hypothetical protein [Elusimicrobiota bacterium]